jgi:hypothetical protein
MSLFEDRGALFSKCRTYRYALWRVWDERKRHAVFIMLNPSTADEVANDPTVERCQRRAISMGTGGVWVVNLFALRSTDPAALYSHPEPIGQDNDQAILIAAKAAGVVICAWGKHGNFMNRGQAVADKLKAAGITTHYLELNKDGTPKHPLYVGYAKQPQPWKDCA